MNVLVLRRLSRCALEFIGFRTRSPNALEPIGFKVLRFKDKKINVASSFAVANDTFISGFGVYKDTKKKKVLLAIDDGTAAPARSRLKKRKLEL